MARERISLVPDEQKEIRTLETRIRSGEINPDNFNELSPEEQSKVNELLFNIASSKIKPNVGTSSLEFILFGYIRIMNKKISGLALSAEEKEIEASLNRIFDLHQITDTRISKADWLFDYMGYAEKNAKAILDERAEHIARKQQVTGYPL